MQSIDLNVTAQVNYNLRSAIPIAAKIRNISQTRTL